MIKTDPRKKETKTSKPQSDLQPPQARELIIENKDNPDFVLLDVCTEREFKQRHLEDARNISFLSGSFKSEISRLDKNRTYLVYCAVGVRSAMALKSMKKSGFKEVFNLVGGTVLWEEHKYPFAKGADTITGFTVCPVTNSQLMARRMKGMFKKMGMSKMPDDVCNPETCSAWKADKETYGGQKIL